LLERVRRAGPPLRGVVHSAGVLDDAALVHQDEARFARVFAPKVHGAWLMDRLTRSDPLDFFVLFSSVAALLGSRGQANHCAANAYLDALARERQRQGLPGLSINWGAWTDVGAAADRGLTERMASVGLGAFSPQQGLSVFERLLGDGHAQVAALLIDWSRYVGLAHGGQPAAFLTEVATRSQSGAVAAPRQASAASLDMRATLRQAMPSRRRSLLSAFVGEHARRALGIDASQDLDPRMPLGELGLDSLLAVDLRNALGKALGEALSATLLFDYPTVDALTDYLLAEVIGPDNSGAAQPVSEPRREPSLVGEIEDLSDEEVDRQLAARAAAGR
jgi:acyl carrier protein